MKSFVVWFEFHWSLILWVQLTIGQHWIGGGGGGGLNAGKCECKTFICYEKTCKWASLQSLCCLLGRCFHVNTEFIFNLELMEGWPPLKFKHLLWFAPDGIMEFDHVGRRVVNDLLICRLTLPDRRKNCWCFPICPRNYNNTKAVDPSYVRNSWDPFY